jgi:putative SOS response-associated peptidase YedK
MFPDAPALAEVAGNLAIGVIVGDGRRVCTAYEIGRQAAKAKAPARMRREEVDALHALGELRIVRPTLRAPVMVGDGGLLEMGWGFRRQFRGAKGQPVWRTVVNAREDKLASPMWADAFKKRRCVIPASAFYEWTEGPGGKALPLRFTAADDALLWIAGIWEETDAGRCFSMLTTEPSAMIRPVHDRMPAVLSENRIAPFLDGGLNELGASDVPLRHVEAANFLRSGVRVDGPELPLG